MLVVRLDRAQSVDVPRSGRHLRRGAYLYFGSARGPGGLGARIVRHLRSDKRVHWHIDHLTAVGRITAVLIRAHGHECDWRSRAQRVLHAPVPLPRFGSSDCSRCPAHLLASPGGFSGRQRLMALARSAA